MWSKRLLISPISSQSLRPLSVFEGEHVREIYRARADSAFGLLMQKRSAICNAVAACGERGAVSSSFLEFLFVQLLSFFLLLVAHKMMGRVIAVAKCLYI